jgi:hypothetical protein
MQKWEYLTVLIDAKTEITHERLDPLGQKMFQYNPSRLMPQLNELGAVGWELISSTPVVAGSNQDLKIATTGPGEYGRVYLCIFKRPIESAT